jgi:hypothetical protein
LQGEGREGREFVHKFIFRHLKIISIHRPRAFRRIEYILKFNLNLDINTKHISRFFSVLISFLKFIWRGGRALASPLRPVADGSR